MYRSCNTKLDQLADEKQCEEKKIKRKKKKSKIQENEGAANTKVPHLSLKEKNGSHLGKKSKTQENEGVASMELPHLSMKEKSESHLEVRYRNSDADSSQVRMMSNGLAIEELITGKPDGKVACQGKKASLFVFS